MRVQATLRAALCVLGVCAAGAAPRVRRRDWVADLLRGRPVPDVGASLLSAPASQ